MAEQHISFTDGAGYERMMGIWSRSAGEIFLDWLAPAKGLAWADIGCGNGAFTELLVDRVAPSSIVGVDPSPQQLAYARERHTAGIAQFHQGDAMALPVADRSVDASAMALVIFFVPEPEKGMAEMLRVTRPGGSIAAYAWDFLDGGFPWEPVHRELRAIGYPPPAPPSAEIARMDNLRGLWEGAGLQAVDTCAIIVERQFASFDEFWAIAELSPALSRVLSSLDTATMDGVKARVRANVRLDGDKVVLSARANAAKGIVPA